MVSTLTLVGCGLMLAGLLAVAVETHVGAGSALLTFEGGGDDGADGAEADDSYAADD